MINPDKQGKQITIEAGGQNIKHQPSLRVLGFDFAEDGRMDTYIWKGTDNLLRSIQTKTSMVRAVKPYTSQEQLAYITNSTLNSQILYVAPLWSQTGENNIKKIQAAQTRAARLMVWSQRTRKIELEHRQLLF